MYSKVSSLAKPNGLRPNGNYPSRELCVGYDSLANIFSAIVTQYQNRETGEKKQRKIFARPDTLTSAFVPFVHFFLPGHSSASELPERSCHLTIPDT